MKKYFIIILTAVLLVGCSNGGGGNTPTPPEPQVKGTMHDFGRFSALVPEGWSVADIGEFKTD